MGNEQSSPLQQAAAHDDIDKVHALIAQNRIELNGTDKVTASIQFQPIKTWQHLMFSFYRMVGLPCISPLTGVVTES